MQHFFATFPPEPGGGVFRGFRKLATAQSKSKHLRATIMTFIIKLTRYKKLWSIFYISFKACVRYFLSNL